MEMEQQARSSVVEHCFDVARVSGSIPLAPTMNLKVCGECAHRFENINEIQVYNHTIRFLC